MGLLVVLLFVPSTLTTAGYWGLGLFLLVSRWSSRKYQGVTGLDPEPSKRLPHTVPCQAPGGPRTLAVEGGPPLAAGTTAPPSLWAASHLGESQSECGPMGTTGCNGKRENN